MGRAVMKAAAARPKRCGLMPLVFTEPDNPITITPKENHLTANGMPLPVKSSTQGKAREEGRTQRRSGDVFR